MIRRPPISTRTDTLFPYTTLFRSWHLPAGASARLKPGGAAASGLQEIHSVRRLRAVAPHAKQSGVTVAGGQIESAAAAGAAASDRAARDRKSTRLNSSH